MWFGSVAIRFAFEAGRGQLGSDLVGSENEVESNPDQLESGSGRIWVEFGSGLVEMLAGRIGWMHVG